MQVPRPTGRPRGGARPLPDGHLSRRVPVPELGARNIDRRVDCQGCGYHDGTVRQGPQEGKQGSEQVAF